jgi:hypothetical protein
MVWYFEIANMLVCVLATLIACRINLIPYWIGFILIIYSILPFFLNDFLFPARYMKDQFFYFRAMSEVRSFNLFPEMDMVAVMTSWFLSILPIPFVETIKSIGFFNRFLFLILFLWLYSKKFLQGMTLFFVLFYPSLVLYTSLSFRDPLILFFMIVGTICLVDKKYLTFFLVILPLYFIKFQNFFFMLILLGIFMIFKKPPLNYRIRYIFFGLIIFGLYTYIDDIIYLLDLSRRAFFIEDGNDLPLYEPIVDFFNMLFLGATSLLEFVMKPLPWQADNSFQLIQSIENILVLFFLIIFTLNTFKKDKLITIKWILFFSFVMSVHGIIVFNYGTAVRYKFIFIMVYVVGLAYEIYKVHGHLLFFDFKKVISKKE